MLTRRPAAERGKANHGWLDTRHTFSFADYHDPRHMGFRALRVINEDKVAPGMGFGTHGHRDMEILSYVISGSLAHRDSMGTGSVIRPGEVQRMTAGTGVMHSERNPSATEPVHFLQIWLLPSARGLTPGYDQRAFDFADGKLRCVASPDGRDGSLRVNTNATLYAAKLEGDASYPHAAGRHGWVQVVRGQVSVIDGDSAPVSLEAGDGAAISSSAATTLRFVASGAPCELLWFDLG
jgi:redox-sensitive bicupin YhaK (pirin superfamily)